MRHTTVKFSQSTEPTKLLLTTETGIIAEYVRLDKGVLAPGIEYIVLLDDNIHKCQIVGIKGLISEKALKELSTSEASHKVIADLQKVKNAMGPVIGRLKKHWPEAKIWLGQAIDIYERAKALQNEIGRLR